MNQFRAERTSGGQLFIGELVRTACGYLWRNVCMRQLNRETGEYE